MMYPVKVTLGIILLVDLFLIARVEIRNLYYFVPIYPRSHGIRKGLAIVLATVLIFSTYF